MNPYEILGIEPTATPEEIKAAYRAMAMDHHPDRKGGDHAIFQNVLEAYELLSDPDMRGRYDATGSTGPMSDAEKRLDQLMKHAVASGSWDIDIVEDMRRQLRKAMNGIERANFSQGLTIETLRKRLGRVKGGPGMDRVLQHVIDDHLRVVEANKGEYARVEEVMALLMDYRDTKELPLAWITN